MSKYMVVVDGGDFIDGFERDTLPEAIRAAQGVLEEWIVEETVNWPWECDDDPSTISPEQIDSWNTMIDTCMAYVVDRNDTTGEWNSIDDALWPATDADLNELGWINR